MGYTAFDRFVAFLRFRAAARHIQPQGRVCDIGCGLDARFLQFIESRSGFSVGLDYQVKGSEATNARIVRCDITKGLPLVGEIFNCAVMLAVLEHLAQPKALFEDIFRILAPGGLLVMTWPQAVIDPLLDVLHKLGFVSGEMESDMHQPRIPPAQLISTLQSVGYTNFEHTKFEFGLNNLLVCKKPSRG
jgi:SAM-dependent methyltransferase